MYSVAEKLVKIHGFQLKNPQKVVKILFIITSSTKSNNSNSKQYIFIS